MQILLLVEQKIGFLVHYLLINEFFLLPLSVKLLFFYIYLKSFHLSQTFGPLQIFQSISNRLKCWKLFLNYEQQFIRHLKK